MVSERFRSERSGCDSPIEMCTPFMRQMPAQSVIRLLHLTEMNFNAS